EAIIDAFNDGYVFALQEEQLGTGHAAKSAEPVLSDYDGPLLVCYGDMPLMSKNTFEIAIEKHISENNSCTLITGIGDESFAYGRIIRNADGSFKKVVELKDCSTEQKKIFEMNTGVYVFDSRKMFAALGKIKNNNAQKEYYLTDVPGIMQKEGMKIGTYTIPDKNEMLGVNTLEDLELCEKILKSK
ncbi:MAG: UDP-N-acetylglucosamine diphosphorylase, partial [Oscillospiraceae bacterium]|nr:UDP-N-acetylglucosamine diphosphorylase [Oscillospiraceae bacterium]